jgi:hypothetical protein
MATRPVTGWASRPSIAAVLAIALALAIGMAPVATLVALSAHYAGEAK